jgi:hypothetical protein
VRAGRGTTNTQKPQNTERKKNTLRAGGGTTNTQKPQNTRKNTTFLRPK